MRFRTLVAAALFAAAPLALTAQQSSSAHHPSTQSQASPSVVANPTPDPTDKTYPIEQIVTATVHDAWVLSNKNEDAFFDIVEQLAQFSAQKRGVTLPDTAAAGRRLGELIKTRAKADHDALLYAIVDQAVRTVAKGQATAAGSSK